MAEIATNRDLYLAVAGLIAERREDRRPLEDYLRAVWSVARGRQSQPAFTAGEFFRILADGFTADPPPFEEAWRTRYEDDHRELPGFAGWEARILRQVVDLREMAESGQLADKLRYFGIDSPRGSRWYNFDPCTFLECAMAGSFGGWQEGDDTGRDYVPGEVAVLGPDGRIIGCDPRDLDNPVTPLAEVTWDDFQHFLGQGQWYE
jgi:hypothetical protein